jgi:hypothetical protein
MLEHAGLPDGIAVGILHDRTGEPVAAALDAALLTNVEGDGVSPA